MINTGPHKIEMDKWISCAPFESLLNMKILEAKDGNAVLKMPFLKQFAQGAGLLHGGALVALADTAVVMAIKSILPPNTHFATIELNASFLAPVTKGYVTAFANVKKSNKERVLNGFAYILDSNDKKVLEFTSLFKIARKNHI